MSNDIDELNTLISGTTFNEDYTIGDFIFEFTINQLNNLMKIKAKNKVVPMEDIVINRIKYLEELK